MKEPFARFVETELPTGFLLIACGLPATGKTVITTQIAVIKGCRLLRSDLIRQEVLRDEDVFDEKVAASMEKRTRVYDEMFRQADEALSAGNCVILDATFVTQSLRRRAAAVAARQNVSFVILETVCPQEVAVRRILSRTREKYESNALTEQAYLDNKKRFEAVDLADLQGRFPGLNISHLRVDTRDDSSENWYIIRVGKR